MKLTLGEVSQTESFAGLELVAGKEGLSRTLSTCALLDYEFVKSLKDKYVHSNFHQNQLVITSLLYAKDNPYLLRDAVRHLIDIDACGLVVNNVFRLELPETVLRFADAKGFPVFVVRKQPFDVCSFVVGLHDNVKDLERADFGDKEIGFLLHAPAAPDEVRASALRMNPSFYPQVAACYLRKESELTTEEYVRLVDAYRQSPQHSNRNALYRYRNGLMYLVSREDAGLEGDDVPWDDMVRGIIGDDDGYAVGVGAWHYDLSELDRAMSEAIDAAMVNRGEDALVTRYATIGSYQAILPLADQPAMTEYARSIIEPLIEHDAAYHTELLPTLLDYVAREGNLRRLALDRGQHENTLRYRFGQIAKVTGLNPIRAAEYEQLALAVKIHRCKGWMR